MAFVLVQHLDPTHPSMMVELLSRHTSMAVVEAREGMRLEPDHVYIIPPGHYLAVRDGALRLTRPGGRQGVRMSFDFLLQSVAETLGKRVVCIILSGTGTDGSIGEGFRTPAIAGRASGHGAGVRKPPMHEPAGLRRWSMGISTFAWVR
jgi:two-component system CheB/CheR fusion protein